jgi:leucyl-tRNA synthetase
LVNSSDELDIEKFKSLREDCQCNLFVMKNGKYIVVEIENVEIQIQCGNLDDICNEYGADTLRLYEMF